LRRLRYLPAAGANLDAFYAIDVVICLLVLGAAIGLAAAGISTAVCLLVVTAAPGTIVVSFELFGHRHLAEVMARSLSALGGRD
jgi:fatty acid desaturase